MKRITIGICFVLVFFLTSCGKQSNIESAGTEQIEQKATETINYENEVEETEQHEMSELELQIEEFKNNTPSEITLVQDLLRGEWHLRGRDVILNGGCSGNNIELGEVKVSYDTKSKDSVLIFTNDEFLIVYDDATIYYGEDRCKILRSAIVVSGLYRVTNAEKGNYYETGSYEAEIEMMITEISPKYGLGNTDGYEALNSAIGTVTKKPIEFSNLFLDLSGVTQEQIEDYNLQINEPVDKYYYSGFGYRADGSYGLIKYDTPIKKTGSPGMTFFIRCYDNDQIVGNESYDKMNNNVRVYNGDIEPGVILHEVMPLGD